MNPIWPVKGRVGGSPNSSRLIEKATRAKRHTQSYRSRKHTHVTMCGFLMVCVTRAWDHRIVRDTSLELYMSFRRHCPSCCQWGDCFRIFLFIKHLVIYLLITVPSSMCRHSINIKRVMEKSYWKLGNYCKLKTLPIFGISISRRQNCGGFVLLCFVFISGPSKKKFHG